jgi:hypothetical protein
MPCHFTTGFACTATAKREEKVKVLKALAPKGKE